MAAMSFKYPVSNKYNAKKTSVDGIVFDSKVESEYYLYLKKEKAHFSCQPKVHLSKALILYRPDFAIYINEKKIGVKYFVDVKGSKRTETKEFRLKKRLWKHYGTAPLHLVKSNSSWVYDWDVYEIIVPISSSS